MGEAADEAAARLMIESQQRGSVTWRERVGRWRRTLVLDGGKTSHGWAETEPTGGPRSGRRCTARTAGRATWGPAACGRCLRRRPGSGDEHRRRRATTAARDRSGRCLTAVTATLEC